MNKAPSGEFATTVYMSEELASAIKKRVAELQSQRPGERVTVSDVIRGAIAKGLNIR